MVHLEELRRCQINEWYSLFRRHTIPTLFLPLPPPFLSYLQGLSLSASDDGSHSPAPFLLPSSTTPFHKFPPHVLTADPDSNFDDDGEGEDGEGEVKAPSFPELESEVERSIAELGGAAVPKLNWSAPTDATWMSPFGTLKCESFSEVCLLLHSSDCIIHDLTEALPSAQDYVVDRESKDDEFGFVLALRKWVPDIRPELEFRCFVRGKNLVGICQREVTAFYPSLLTQQEQIVDSICDFFDQIVKPGFGSEDYTFDVYLTEKQMKVVLVDFNPWGGFTLPLLFEWEDLGQERGDVELRIVESSAGVRPGMKTAVPYDYLDMGEGSGWDEFFRKAELEIRSQMATEKEKD